jgi:hypothetical protein
MAVAAMAVAAMAVAAIATPAQAAAVKTIGLPGVAQSATTAVAAAQVVAQWQWQQ